ncbi:BcbE [Bibersteinia trehalosi USDA-ARS-USMARC-189]|uniref:BcbE n=1 Tax=Bibersteinia trehalosi USDA-ARS-USMARC-189 TaxID=1263831 RepID=A0ABM5PF83_BIBTR|nr:glycosyltransferase family 2 protein [Bibersteinia trehalosi]AGH37707.1 BcbE [Bibersteinia trehalosi USDA-ARS-USMARC-192]AHG84815.1 BcbE [Bibersteinia trehalosi USDA-ARS-USMARC-189]
MFIIPMAGLSSRFFKAGYTKPKYQLDLNGESVFSWSVKSFEKYFKTDKFVFIYRDVYETKSFLEQEISKLGIIDYELVCLPNETLGQADTVYQGISHISSDDEIYIFNIDSRIVNFTKPSWVSECDGYLEVFKGEGEHWSFAQPQENSRRVVRTTEKERISDLCSDGLYYFKQKSVFEELFLNARKIGNTTKNEYYIAPLYNDLISQQAVVFYDLITSDRILFCGTPDEYLGLLNSKEYV